MTLPRYLDVSPATVFKCVHPRCLTRSHRLRLLAHLGRAPRPLLPQADRQTPAAQATSRAAAPTAAPIPTATPTLLADAAGETGGGMVGGSRGDGGGGTATATKGSDSTVMPRAAEVGRGFGGRGEADGQGRAHGGGSGRGRRRDYRGDEDARGGDTDLHKRSVHAGDRGDARLQSGGVLVVTAVTLRGACITLQAVCSHPVDVTRSSGACIVYT